MGSDTPSGVTGDVLRDDAEGASSRTVAEGFFSRERMIPDAYGPFMTPLGVYFGGEGAFSVHFGKVGGAEFTLMTDDRGIDAMIDTLQAVKVRAQHEREAVGLPAVPPPRSVAPVWLTDADVPF
jgi:hypothetical protein